MIACAVCYSMTCGPVLGSQWNQEQKCYNCGEKGHVKAECPKLGEKKD